MGTKTKTWTDKLLAKKEPKIKRIDFKFADIPPGSIMYIPTPQIIQDYVSQIPMGYQVDIKTLRNDLALENKADYTCPVTTGIFLRIVAEAAFEKHGQGTPLNEITPFWRVINEKSNLAKKLTFGTEIIQTQRASEGLT